MGILASEKFLKFFDSYGKGLIFMQNIHPCVFLMSVAEGKSAATPLNFLNPNKAQLDL